MKIGIIFVFLEFNMVFVIWSGNLLNEWRYEWMGVLFLVLGWGVGVGF